jgi:hypothetical protein
MQRDIFYGGFRMIDYTDSIGSQINDFTRQNFNIVLNISHPLLFMTCIIPD